VEYLEHTLLLKHSAKWELLAFTGKGSVFRNHRLQDIKQGLISEAKLKPGAKTV
jgi:hypothetical protein